MAQTDPVSWIGTVVSLAFWAFLLALAVAGVVKWWTQHRREARSECEVDRVEGDTDTDR